MYDIFFALFFTYLGNILLKTIHMKTWTLIWITSYSKMMVRDIFHFRKVHASTMGLYIYWSSILIFIHLRFHDNFVSDFTLQRYEFTTVKTQCPYQITLPIPDQYFFKIIKIYQFDWSIWLENMFGKDME